MSWSRNDFLDILNAELAKKIFSDPEVQNAFGNWDKMHQAALLHANGIHAATPYEYSLQLIQLVAAFTKKDYQRMHTLIVEHDVTVGVRLDYLLPLYDEHYHAGEDIFVASTKYMLGGDAKNSVKLEENHLRHGDTSYSADELAFVTNYVDNSTQIRELLANAKNKTATLPTKTAIDFMIRNAKTYRDSNNNPVMVFIPGAISIPHYPTAALIENTLLNGGNINDVGFFGIPGIVWSIILGDVVCTNRFIELHAKLNLVDDMGNKHVLAWAATTLAAAKDDPAFKARMVKIIDALTHKTIINEMQATNHRGTSSIDYLKLADEEPELNFSNSLTN